jgi:hypothetical protein
MKNFNEFFTENSIVDNVKKILEAEGNFDVLNNDLLTEIKEFLLTEYPSSWWADEFTNRLSDYISDEDLVGYGDSDDESTWDYETPEEAYQNLCSGGAIEYDLLTEIRNDIIEKFHISSEEYDRMEVVEIVKNHMCNMCDWYDHALFGNTAVDFGDIFGRDKGYQKLMNDFKNLPTEIKTPDGRTIQL